MAQSGGGDGVAAGGHRTGETPREFALRAALEEMVRAGASDLHLKVGRPPVLRIGGELRESPLPALRPDDLKRCVEQLTAPEQREQLAARREMDFAVGVQGLGRFRVNLFHQRGSIGLAVRAIPFEVPALDELGLPAILQDIAFSARGLVVVTGTTGSGKSTTLAAMIRFINERRPVNVVTIEDPIEFLHRDVRGYVSQREVGADTAGFPEALRHALRQDPDVIMVGEVRDAETMEAVLKAANTGHLVLTTLHTTDAVQTLSRIFSFFSRHQHGEVRWLLAEVLRAVVSLRLIARERDAGRVPAAEVLVNTGAVAERIRAGDQIHTLPDLIAEGRLQYGMQTFDQALMELYRSGAVSLESAVQFASNPGEFTLRASGIQSGAESGWAGGSASPLQG
jgi:twitching motility protein PilT